MNLTNYIAIYGAILSTIAIGWNIYNKLQDKPKIKIKTHFGFMTNDFKKTFFFIDAINYGKRSIYLSSFGLRSGNNDVIEPNPSFGLPCELKPGTSHTEWFDVEKLEKNKDMQFDFAWYKDETGKMYKSKSIKEKLNNYFKSEKESLK
ncbi:MAG: hypothetical protein Q8O84_05535 [Nanoarchaeota archaeon]|nr:hypothetical protein [Nanoarchaeota archaeon]